MSNIYSSEPPTSGKVILVTNYGNIDIELWTKEAPRACRNFIQLCMENYYENNIFHRIIKGFMIQTGDPTGKRKYLKKQLVKAESLSGDTISKMNSIHVCDLIIEE
jgi:cyclophilin family peptidyl-prolyl cis-trans isomerase